MLHRGRGKRVVQRAMRDRRMKKADKWNSMRKRHVFLLRNRFLNRANGVFKYLQNLPQPNLRLGLREIPQ
jgi:hypothetical protein